MDVPTKSQIDRLGTRLRTTDRVHDSDLEMLQDVRRAHDEVLAEVTESLAVLSFQGDRLHPTSRLKTIGTIVDKLKRESVRLSQMDDIAGTRVVFDGGLADQDGITRVIRRAFPVHDVKDRRERPSHGYRAVHVVVVHRDLRVEIQIRTVLQDVWAQLMEKLADSWGRRIRYGEPPLAPETPAFRAGARELTRQEVVNTVLVLADLVGRVERLQADQFGVGPRLVAELRSHLPQELQERSREVEALYGDLENTLRSLMGVDG